MANRFNLTRYNIVKDINKPIELKSDAYTYFDGLFGFAQVYTLNSNAGSSVTAEIRMGLAHTLQSEAGTVMNAEIEAGTAYTALSVADTHMDCEATAAIIYSGLVDAVTEMDCEVLLGFDLALQSMADSFVQCDAHFAYIANLYSDAYSMMSAVITLGTSVSKEISIDVTLQPGDTLVIDTIADYEVLLNGENAAEYYNSVNWPIIDRKTTGIDIDTGTGGDYAASLLYTETYL